MIAHTNACTHYTHTHKLAHYAHMCAQTTLTKRNKDDVGKLTKCLNNTSNGIKCLAVSIRVPLCWNLGLSDIRQDVI